MSENNDVFSQADALMHRHRSFVARSPQDEELAGATEETDIPILTEVVVPDHLVPRSIDEVLDMLQKEIDSSLSVWLVETLPAAITNASQHILTEMDAKTRNILLPRLQEIIEAHKQNPG